MARFTTYNALRKLITVPHTTIATTNGQETRHIFLKNDLDHTVVVTKGGKSGRLGTSNRQEIAMGTKEFIDIVTGDLVRKVTQVTVVSFSGSLVTGMSKPTIRSPSGKRWPWR